jgi:DNA modification methylase/uncharacterized protein YfkK (UPF0435 family)
MVKKRKKEKFEHLDYALVAKGHTPMYVMHKYWARKPHNVVGAYIKHYTKERDIVLDPFVGSGVTALEALKYNRKAIAFDLDPISIFITRNTAKPIEIKKIDEAFNKIKKDVKEKIYPLYETKCPKCGKKAAIICTYWDKDKPKKIMYKCYSCKKRDGKKIEKFDLNKIKDIEKTKISYWYPKNKLYYNHSPFMKKEKNESVPHLFTKRNLLALSILFDSINKLEDNNVKEIMQFAFTSMVHLASKMTPVRPTRPFSSFWALQSYWIPPLYMESNVWLLFDSAVNERQGLIAGKNDSNNNIKEYKEAKKYDSLIDSANIFIKTHNALELTDVIPKNSVDYIFTDPPYGGAVQYFELSTLWASWLKMDLNYKDEITINKFQKKSFSYYHKMLRAAFRQMFLVLKPGKFLTVTFHSTDIKVWNSIIRAIVMSGFDLEKIIYQPPARTSAKGLLQPYGSAVGDYYIRFKKPKTEKKVTEKQLDFKTYELEVIDSAKRIIGERGEPTAYQHILNGIMVELKGGRNVPIGAKNVEEILKENVTSEFELIPVKNKKGRTIGRKWWVKGWDLSHFTQPILSDRIERTVIQVLDGKIKVSFDDILQTIFREFPNALTPDTQDIREILKEYALQTEDGKWRLKPTLTEKIRESQHTKMIYLLAILGKKAGFNVLIGKKEQSEIYENKRLSKLCDRIHALRFVPQEAMAIERIKQIDVLWLEDGRIKYEFEVENTTGITGAIIRGSNIPTEFLKPKRFIVIPKERETLLHRKLQEPLIKQSLEKDKWDFIRYNELEDVYNKLKSKKKISPEVIDSIAKMPREVRQKQNSLSIYL